MWDSGYVCTKGSAGYAWWDSDYSCHPCGEPKYWFKNVPKGSASGKVDARKKLVWY